MASNNPLSDYTELPPGQFCKDGLEYWSRNDEEVPLIMKQILLYWNKYFGTVTKGLKCKQIEGKNYRFNRIDFYLDCGFTSRKTTRTDKLSEKIPKFSINAKKHIHLIFKIKEYEDLKTNKNPLKSNLTLLQYSVKHQEYSHIRLNSDGRTYMEKNDQIFNLDEYYRDKSRGDIGKIKNCPIKLDMPSENVPDLVYEMYLKLGCKNKDLEYFAMPGERKKAIIKNQSVFETNKESFESIAKSIKDSDDFGEIFLNNPADKISQTPLCITAKKLGVSIDECST